MFSAGVAWAAAAPTTEAVAMLETLVYPVQVLPFPCAPAVLVVNVPDAPLPVVPPPVVTAVAVAVAVAVALMLAGTVPDIADMPDIPDTLAVPAATIIGAAQSQTGKMLVRLFLPCFFLKNK